MRWPPVCTGVTPEMLAVAAPHERCVYHQEFCMLTYNLEWGRCYAPIGHLVFALNMAHLCLRLLTRAACEAHPTCRPAGCVCGIRELRDLVKALGALPNAVHPSIDFRIHIGQDVPITLRGRADSWVTWAQ